MGGKEILHKVAEIIKQKEEKEKKTEKTWTENRSIQVFHQFKFNCVYEKIPCKIKNLTKCPKCHNMLRSAAEKLRMQG